MKCEREAKREVAEAGRLLLEEKLVARTWGNVSCRTGDASFVITPSGLSYEEMTAEDTVAYDMDTGTWSGSRKPSSEKGVHAAAYRQFPDAAFVIHTHQTYASALGLAGFDALPLSGGAGQALGGVARAEYGLPGTKKLRENVSAALASGAHAILMMQHGALIAGRDRSEAFERAKLLELVCKSACKGQPERAQSGSERLSALARQAGKAFSHIAFTSAPAVVETAGKVEAFRAQLDDMAQMIGPKLITVEGNAEAAEKALRKHNAVLIAGMGAICRAESECDCDALRLLMEKACVCFLHTQALGAAASLSFLDARLMRLVYQTKYSKKIGG